MKNNILTSIMKKLNSKQSVGVFINTHMVKPFFYEGVDYDLVMENGVIVDAELTDNAVSKLCIRKGTLEAEKLYTE